MEDVENLKNIGHSSIVRKEKENCLMACTKELYTDEERNSSLSIFEVDLVKGAKDSKLQIWDPSSLYQVNNFTTYSENKKAIMFNYLCQHHSKFNQ